MVEDITQARLYYQGPDPEVNFIVDDASVTELVISHGWRNATDTAIDQYRKSDIHIQLKVRGHNIVWSVEKNIQPWVKQLSGDELRSVVKQHIEMDMNVTRGLLEHWDVNNENLHGQWFQDRLHDPDYNLEIFHITHNADPNVKLFLNDFGVGVARAGVPIWVTELDVMAQDENKRADYIEKALRALYGHPAVEGIIFWGFDEHNWRGDKAALVMGSNLELTAAGRRVLDLLENQWMTDETHVLSQSGDQFTVRGFHGNYDVRVMYNGHELRNLRKTVHLGRRVLDLYESEWMTDETHVLTQSGDQFTVRGFHGDYELRVMYHGKELRSLRKTFQLGKTAVTIDLAVHT
nr:hypothetical protein BaRGS_007477 [Batillaria attramentaria]